MPGNPWNDDLHYTAPTSLAVAANAIAITLAQHLVQVGTVRTLNKGAANVTAVAGDEVGENVITGAHRASATASEGAGLGQVEVELKAAIRDPNPVVFL